MMQISSVGVFDDAFIEKIYINYSLRETFLRKTSFEEQRFNKKPYHIAIKQGDKLLQC